VGLRQVAAEEPPHEVGIADLSWRSSEGSCDLRIEYWSYDTRERIEHFEILPAGVHHLYRRRYGEGPHQCAQIVKEQWIDACGYIARCDLDQAQLRPIGAFAQKFSVDSERVRCRQASGKLRQVLRGGDDGLQRVQR
jgi:hypothetical protein